MSIRILITGTTGDSMPPPYAGVQNVSLLYARSWRKLGNSVGITFVYKPDNADDLGANAEYFFEYNGRANKPKKLLFLIKYFFSNPFLYLSLLFRYLKIYPRISIETILYSAYGVWVDGVISSFKPDIIDCQTTLIKSFMVAEIAKNRKIPVIFEPYAEVHDLKMGVNKHLDEKGREKYWKYFLNLSRLVIGMDNCSIGPLMYLPKERVKVFYDTCDFSSYQIEIKESVSELRATFGLPEDLMLVGMMGAFHYRKGHDHLIKAIAMLKKGGHRVGATIVGGSVGLEKWIQLAREENVEDRVFFFQNFGEDKKIRLYKCIDVYANFSNSTRSCGLDLALLEAMSCGLPIVAYDNGALPNAIPEGKNGITVHTGDIKGIADALGILNKKSHEERKTMGEESRKIASKTDVNLTAKIKEKWFQDVISNFNK